MFSIKCSQFREENKLFQLYSHIHSVLEETVSKLLKQRSMNICSTQPTCKNYGGECHIWQGPCDTSEEPTPQMRLWHYLGKDTSACPWSFVWIDSYPTWASYLQDQPQLSSHTVICFVKHPIKLYNVGMIRKKLQNVVFCLNLFIHILNKVKKIHARISLTCEEGYRYDIAIK